MWLRQLFNDLKFPQSIIVIINHVSPKLQIPDSMIAPNILKFDIISFKKKWRIKSLNYFIVLLKTCGLMFSQRHFQNLNMTYVVIQLELDIK
jgi:hypothetical protein